MPKDLGETGGNKSGTFSWDPIKSPKQSEEMDGVQNLSASKTGPSGMAKPKK